MKKPTRIRKMALASLATLSTLGATAALDASPASAATAVTFCFRFQNPPNFTSYANRPVYLYDQLPHGEWRLLRSGSTNASGCGTFYNTNPTVPLAVRAYTSTAFQTWDGWSQIAGVGNGTSNLGTGNVWRTR